MFSSPVVVLWLNVTFIIFEVIYLLKKDGKSKKVWMAGSLFSTASEPTFPISSLLIK